MARMIPPEFQNINNSDAEEHLYFSLKKTFDDTWTIFHSYSFESRNRDKKLVDSEIDFLLLNKDYGILILEVKRTTVSPRPRPYHYNPENQKNCISPKNKFGYASWFATFNNKIPEIKEIWKRSKLKGRDAYHRMMSYNIKRSDINRLTEKNVLTPPGLILEVKEAAITGDNISAHLEILDGFLSSPLVGGGLFF